MVECFLDAFSLRSILENNKSLTGLLLDTVCNIFLYAVMLLSSNTIATTRIHAWGKAGYKNLEVIKNKQLSCVTDVAWHDSCNICVLSTIFCPQRTWTKGFKNETSSNIPKCYCEFCKTNGQHKTQWVWVSCWYCLNFRNVSCNTSVIIMIYCAKFCMVIYSGLWEMENEMKKNFVGSKFMNTLNIKQSTQQLVLWNVGKVLVFTCMP